MSMKRVCIVVQNFYDVDPRVRREANSLIKNGYFVNVIALRYAENPQKQYTLDGVRVFTLPVSKERTGRLNYLWEYGLFLILALLMLSQHMFIYKYDIVQVCTVPDLLIFSAIIPKLMRAKVILDMHEIMPEFYMSKFGLSADHWMIRLLKWQEKLSAAFADHVVTVNDPIKELLVSRGLPRDKITVVTNSADRELFMAHINSCQHYNDQDNGQFVMTYHGTLTSMYGLDVALRSFASIHQKMDGAEFRIIGDGPERRNLELLANDLGISEKVSFIGRVPQQEIPYWLARCHIGVLPTRKDAFLDMSFSNKLCEYIIMKRPVVIARLNAIRHYFGEESLAFFEAQNETDLAEKILDLYENSSLREKFADNALCDYSVIDWTVMEKRYLSIFEALYG